MRFKLGFLRPNIPSPFEDFWNYHKKLAQGKEPSLQQYRFSSYAESRLLSAALCSVMDSVDKAGMTEVVRSGMTHMVE